MAEVAGTRGPALLVVLQSDEPATIAAYTAGHHASVDVYITDHVDRLIGQTVMTRPTTLLTSMAALGSHPVETIGRLRHLIPDTMIAAFSTDPALTETADLITAGCQAILTAVSYDALGMLLANLMGKAAEPVPGAPGGAPAHVTLTAREREVLLGMAGGLTNPSIARSLHISVDTVKTHARRIYTTLGARDRAQAVYLAMRLGLLTSDHDPAVFPSQRSVRSSRPD